MAIGIRDLASTDRFWPQSHVGPCISGNFSEDAKLTASLVQASISPPCKAVNLAGSSPATKHFPGGGPQKKDSIRILPLQKGQIYPGNNFDYHLIPFWSCFQHGTAAIMPLPWLYHGSDRWNVGMSYNKTIITKLLRRKIQVWWGGLQPTGVWSAMTYGARCSLGCQALGIESLTGAKGTKILEAGCDRLVVKTNQSWWFSWS